MDHLCAHPGHEASATPAGAAGQGPQEQHEQPRTCSACCSSRRPNQCSQAASSVASAASPDARAVCTRMQQSSTGSASASTPPRLRKTRSGFQILNHDHRVSLAAAGSVHPPSWVHDPRPPHQAAANFGTTLPGMHRSYRLPAMQPQAYPLLEVASHHPWAVTSSQEGKTGRMAGSRSWWRAQSCHSSSNVGMLERNRSARCRKRQPLSLATAKRALHA